MKIAGICSKHGYYKGERCPKCKEREKKKEIIVRAKGPSPVPGGTEGD